MKAILLTLLTLVSTAFAAGIDQATTEQAGTNAYRISFQAPADTGEIAIYASSRADRIDTEKPVLEKATSPATVTFASEHRVYFHLKPAIGPTRVVSIRALPLEGGINFRDIGGYKTAEGKFVRWGLVYRSAKLDRLTPRDFNYLSSLNLKLVCDFRIESERNVALTKWQGENGPEIFFNPIDTVNGPRASRQAAAARAAAAGGTNSAVAPTAQGARGARGGGGGGLTETYRWMATEGLDQFAVLLKRIANGDTPTLFHCQEGRGRTGVFAALVLMSLGVPRDIILQDFMLTNDLLLTDEALTRMINSGNPNQTIDGLRRSLAVNADYLNASFTAIDQRFPSFDAFLRDGLKLSDAELTSLRTRLLEN